MRKIMLMLVVLVSVMSSITAIAQVTAFSSGATQPRDLVVSSDGQYLYVANGNEGDGYVTKIRLSDYVVVDSVFTNYDPLCIAITPNAGQGGNVALQSNGGNASAISEGTYLGQTKYAYYANDSDSFTSWCSSWDMPAWLKIEFDQIYTINRVGVWWASHQHTFSISLSTDGTNWNTVVPSRLSNNYEGSPPVHESFPIPSTDAKYIRIDITTTSAPPSHIFQAAVCELEAYSKGQYLYVTNTVNGYYTSKIDVYSFTKLTDISGGTDPAGLDITPDGSTVVITNHWSSFLQLVSIDTNAEVGRIYGISTGAYDVVITPDGNYAYVTARTTGPSPGSGVLKVSLVDTIVVDTIPVDGGEEIDITPDGSEVWVPRNVHSDYVYIISTVVDSIVDSVAVGSRPRDVKISGDGRYAYVLNGLDNTVSKISIQNRSVVGIVATGLNPRCLAISPDGSKLYVTNYGENTITEIYTDSIPSFYLPGNVGMLYSTWPPSVQGADVTYLVNFMRQYEANQPCFLNGFWCSADVNGNCSIDGGDVTALVNVMRTILPAPMWCDQYPPAWETTDDLPDTAPDGWPNCETLPVSATVIPNEPAHKVNRSCIFVENPQLSLDEDKLTIDIYLTSVDPVAFIGLPLAWESNEIVPSSIIPGPALKGWDVVSSDIKFKDNYMLMLAWHDLGGETNEPLYTNDEKALIYQIVFDVNETDLLNDLNIAPTIDSRCGGVHIGLEDGLTVYQPDIKINLSGLPTAVIDDDINLPSEYSLSQNYPNPFNPTTTIDYALPEASNVILDVYDILGRKVETLVSEQQQAGYHSITWNASDQTSGMYFYKIQAGNYTETKKMLLLK